jgi:hypothetical protein
MSPHFLQLCPVCGRPVRIGGELDGGMVTCRHCRGTFRACSAGTRASDEGCRENLLRRADRLLRLLSKSCPRSAPWATN